MMLKGYNRKAADERGKQRPSALRSFGLNPSLNMMLIGSKTNQIIVPVAQPLTDTCRFEH